MDDYIATNSRVQGPPDSPSMWTKDGPTAEKWGGGNIANDNVPVAEQPVQLMYDPPGGWQYGFPKEYRPLEGETLEDTLERDGYPVGELGARHCRFFESAANDYRPVASATRVGDWMQTFTGRQAWPLDMRSEDIDIQDIAHSLAMQCRFAGHCKEFYSVAEHSVHVSDWVRDNHCPQHALWALLHDASEAYLVDVPRPVKPYLAGYKDAERAVMRAVCDRFGLPYGVPAEVHEADSRILWDEQSQIMAPCVAKWAGTPDPLNINIQRWSPAFAKAAFLMRFSALTVGASEERRAA